MKLFSKAGNRAFATTDVMNGDAIDEKVYISPTIDTESGEIYLKLVNSEAIAKDLQIKLDNRNIYKVVLEYINSDDTSIKNQGAQNYYSSYPGIVNFNYNEAIVPQTTGFGPVKKSFNINIPENSVCVIKLIPEK
jgi:alpha-L-arabinofuranosidase